MEIVWKANVCLLYGDYNAQQVSIPCECRDLKLLGNILQQVVPMNWVFPGQ